MREELLLALCTDHGHLNQQGSLHCRTCNRRVDAILDVMRREVRDLLVGARMAITTDTADDGEKMTARYLLDEAIEKIDN